VVVAGQAVHTGAPREPHTHVWPQAVVQVVPGEHTSGTEDPEVAAGVPVPEAPEQEEGQVPYLPAPLMWVPLGKVAVEHQAWVTEATGGAHSE
jgi:hypothetical protein